MLDALKIPRMGSVENARFLNWHAAEGAEIAVGDLLYEVETDKVVTEVRADQAFVLVRRIADADAELRIGDTVALIAPAATTRAAIDAALRSRAAAAGAELLDATTAATVPVSAPPAGAVAIADARPPGSRASPRTRRLAREHGVDLTEVRGSGPAGRPTADDVLRSATASPPAASAPLAGAAPHVAVPNSMRRRAIARRLGEAWASVPMLTADVPVDLTALLAARTRLNATLAREGVEPLSILAFVAHATTRTLLDFPTCNATWTETQTLQYRTVNLGIAVDGPDGLIVPVIRGAETLTVPALGAEIARLARRARDGALLQAELEGGTFTISNPGSVGPVLRAEAILNLPQVALLGLPAFAHVPVAIANGDGSHRVEIRPRLVPSLTFDHRALDGAEAVRFLVALKTRLEQAEPT